MVATAACGGGSNSGNEADNGSAAAPTGDPVSGGKVVIGVEAENDGLDPTTANLAAVGHSYAQAVFDTLTILNADGEYVPYLAESVEPNEDYTVWTIKVRSGVTFHDGAPLNADAVIRNLEGHLDSALTGTVLSNVESVNKIDDLTTEVRMTTPWVAFNYYLSTQIGYVAAPSMLDDPDGSLHPVGTGPFVFDEWVPGQRFVLTKNPDYWQEGLPYVDELEFRPIVEGQARVSALQSGEIDLLHTSGAVPAIETLRTLGSQVQIVEVTDGPTDENMGMFNTAAEPFDNLNARLAVAYATDRERYLDTVDHGIGEIATGPFSGQDDYEEPDFPEYDLDTAKDYVEAYEAETGKPLTFEFSITNVSTLLAAAQLLQDMWQEAGIEVEINQVEQTELINNALSGNFQLSIWRQHGAGDPDGEYVWWTIPTEGQLSLNFGRYQNDEVQQLLEEGRQNPDEEARRAAYSRIAEIFAEEVPFGYFTRALWVFAASPDIGGVGGLGFELPDGSEGAPYSGWFFPVRLYRTQ